MDAPMIEGNKKKIIVVNPLRSPTIPVGELTILADPVVTVRKSKTPAALPAMNIDKIKNTPRYM
jgi:hypothetical protein